MVQDVIKNTVLNLKKTKLKKYVDIIKNKKQIATFSNKFNDIESEIKMFLRIKMYQNIDVVKKIIMVKELLKNYLNIYQKTKKIFNKCKPQRGQI